VTMSSFLRWSLLSICLRGDVQFRSEQNKSTYHLTLISAILSRLSLTQLGSIEYFTNLQSLSINFELTFMTADSSTAAIPALTFPASYESSLQLLIQAPLRNYYPLTSYVDTWNEMFVPRVVHFSNPAKSISHT
jgi:hypothetical protein